MATKSNYKSCVNCGASCCAQLNRTNPPVFTKDELKVVADNYGDLPEFQIINYPEDMLKRAGRMGLRLPEGNFYRPVIPDSGACPLSSAGECRIYDHRPTDCRLFPFQVEMGKNGFALTLHYSICIGKYNKDWIEDVALANAGEALMMAASYGANLLIEYALMNDMFMPSKQLEKTYFVCDIPPALINHLAPVASH